VSGCERVEFTLPGRGAAVAATNDTAAGAICKRRDTARIREFGARGWRVRSVRVATSVRRAVVMRKCAVGPPRAACGCEGDRLHTCVWRRARFAGRGPHPHDAVSCVGGTRLHDTAHNKRDNPVERGALL
jgi:hypothetical protein